jgi:branched-chain amino acid transport system substrate-binding protein
MEHTEISHDRLTRYRACPHAVVTLLAVMLLLVAACSSSGTSSKKSSSSETSPTPVTTVVSVSVLGTPSPAKGDPVKIGLISDGKTTIDNSNELRIGPAAVQYLNDYKSGIGGRPIKLITCVDDGDPGKSGDCANQMIQDNVVAVVGGSLVDIDNVWQPLHDAHIPTMFYGASSANLLLDKESTFLLANPIASLVDAPVNVAKDKGITKVTAVVLDVPTASTFF